jgi:hypothetical protein
MALHRSRSVPLRSELGHERLCAPLKIWSTLPLRADPAGWAAIGRFVPGPDSCSARKNAPSRLQCPAEDPPQYHAAVRLKAASVAKNDAFWLP